MISFFERIIGTGVNPVRDRYCDVVVERNVEIWRLVLMVNECANVSWSVLSDILSKMHRHERVLFFKRLAFHHLVKFYGNKYVQHYLTREVVRCVVDGNNDYLLRCVKNGKSEKYKPLEITNRVSLSYNFVLQRFEKVLCLYPEIFGMIEGEHIILGETFCESACNVATSRAKKKIIDVFVVDKELGVGESRGFRAWDKSEYPLVGNKRYHVKIDDDVTVVIGKRVYNCVQECMFENSLMIVYDTRERKFYCSGSFYCYQRIQANRDLVVGAGEKYSKLILTKGVMNTVVQGIVKCYVCKLLFRKNDGNLLELYPSLCIECALDNYRRRVENIRFAGRTALVTGSRIKIGYAVSLELLRAGAFVIGTTRFPMNLIYRLQQELDYEMFKNRFHIYKIDFRDIKMVERFIDYIGARYENLDIFVNNACQTFTYDDCYYREMGEYEKGECRRLCFEQESEGVVQRVSAEMQLRKWPFETDKYGELITRGGEFWTKKCDEVSTKELVETNIVNNIVPCIFISKLRGIMKKSPNEKRYIVNVTCKEGQFNVLKDSNHYHTNAAKAAVNMVVRTIADDYKKDAIYVNSVNPGFISYARDTNVRCPLDCLDAARRILHPITYGETTGNPAYGKIFKNYLETDW
ncbi:MAG: hypothetical protein Harvfovirus12_9 [Harvfovirus sp.]|uniref:Oxidoreductase n=1 Tax=Harvfovirus sp. TaxID=2487768 RepID=A0A3G5A578_9VIRU|nr:MAG: hypothetical protein Harvfovirus12_9 [Harvfovirus sp.]